MPTKEVSCIRKNYKHGFTTIGNEIFFDKDLKNSDVGLLIRLFSLPDDWQFSVEGLSEICADGISAISSSIKRLERAGYLKRTQIRNEEGHYVKCIYDFYDYRYFEENNESEGSEENSENPVQDNPEKENLRMVNTGKSQKVTSSEPIVENPRLDNPSTENLRQYNKYNKINNNKKENNIYSIKEKSDDESDDLRNQEQKDLIHQNQNSACLQDKQNLGANKSNSSIPKIPTFEQVKARVMEKNYCIDPHYFFDYYDALGWFTKAGVPVTNWEITLMEWNQREKEKLADKEKQSVRSAAQARERDLKKARELEQMAYLLCDTPEDEEELRREVALLRGEVIEEVKK